MDTTIDSLGTPTIDSPLKREVFIDDSERVLLDASVEEARRAFQESREPASFTVAGPRSKIFFDPSKAKCALVTCGGLCPGLNNVIRSVVMTLSYNYGVQNILGIRYGLQGFIPAYGHSVMDLGPEIVSEIHELGGTILGSSRGPQSTSDIVDSLQRMNVSILFMIGGDGTFRAASKIAREIRDRELAIGVVGIPKTIDNDLNLLSRSFGFSTAVGVAGRAIDSAHVEALGAPNCVGLVKLMGRYSGFIAVYAALAQREANLVLIPESDFLMEGPHGLLAWLEARLRNRQHAVIVVAEGAGQKYCETSGCDASGNPLLGDIGLWLKASILQHFNNRDAEIHVRYIDPSYMIRSVPANSDDSVFCGLLGQNAVHVAMAGKTDLAVGMWNQEFVCIPIPLVVEKRKRVDINGRLWRSVLELTGQPPLVEERKE
ncbi:ATP-dependent 6-phosphofructokinase [Thermodesulfobacteriota bacterium]